MNNLLQLNLHSTLMFHKKKHKTIVNECLFGEPFKVIEKKSKYSLIQLSNDGYEGWVENKYLINYTGNNFRVVTPNTFIYNQPNDKSETVMYLSIGSLIQAKKFNDKWHTVMFNLKKKNLKGYLPSNHILCFKKKIKDWVQIAENLQNTPYKWGGKSSKGIDCSGLVQLALFTAGYKFPRDTIDQIKLIELCSMKQNRRGTLVFWKGHVGIMVNKNDLLHASGHFMQVVKEKLTTVIERQLYNNKIDVVYGIPFLNN